MAAALAVMVRTTLPEFRRIDPSARIVLLDMANRVLGTLPRTSAAGKHLRNWG
jgi:NADH dehydrogenase FAD-containing subunit